MHEFKIGDYVKWNEGDSIRFGEIMSLSGRSAVIGHRSAYEVFEKRIALSKLTYLPPIDLGYEDYRRLVRFEIDPIDLVAGSCTANVHNTEDYRFTVQDLLAAFERVHEAVEENPIICSIWFACIRNELNSQIQAMESDCFYSESDVLHSMLLVF